MSFLDRLREAETRLAALERERDSLRPGHPDDFKAMARVKTEIGQAKQAFYRLTRNAAPELLRLVEAVRHFRAEQESGDPYPDMVLALWMSLCNALDALEEKG